MNANGPAARSLLGTGGRILSHTAALFLGLALIVAGIGLGVTMVLLPLGVPVALTGLFVFLWGALGTARGRGDQRGLGPGRPDGQAPNP
jgi:hypothetical protein